jgi:WD40 repeat protein
MLLLGLVLTASPGMTLHPASAWQPRFPQTAAERADCHGDPLPPGAVARLGTVRLRHGAGVCAAVWSPDGALIATMSRDQTIRVWESGTGKLRQQFQEKEVEYHAVAFTPDGKTLAGAGGDPLKGGNTSIRLWDVATGREIRRLHGHQQPAYALAFSPDGHMLVGVSCDLVICWDVANGTEMHRWSHLRATAALAVSPDRKLLASVGGETEDRAIHLWDVTTGKELHTLKGHQRGVTSLAFSPDGKTLASGNPFEQHRLWDVAAGKLLHEFEEGEGGLGLAFSPDGKLLATGSMNGAVRLWEVGTGKLLRCLSGYHGWVSQLRFSPDGKALLLAGSDSQTVHLWDVASGRDLRRQHGHQGFVASVAYSPDGRLLATGGGDKLDQDNLIRLWDAHTGKELRQLVGHGSRVNVVAFAPDGRLLASGGDREDVPRLWDAPAGTPQGRLISPRCDQERGGQERRITALAFLPCGQRLLSGNDEGLIQIWDVPTRREIGQLRGHEGRITALALSADGKTLYSGSLDRTVRVWDIGLRKDVRHLGNHGDGIKGLALSPDGKLLAVAVGDWPGKVWLWDLLRQREVGRLEGELSRLGQIAFSPDGKMLVAASADERLRIWEVATRRERKQFAGHPAEVRAVAFSPDGLRLASGSADSTVLVWALTERAAMEERPARFFSTDQLVNLWSDLGSEDAAQAHRAICALLNAPDEAVEFFNSRLQPDPELAPERLARMIADLDDARYGVRAKATSELARLGELAEPLLRKQLSQPSSQEMRRRVELLLRRLEGSTVSPANLRTLRAFEVLEKIGTADARRILERHSREASATRLGDESRSALERLGRQRP